MERSNDREGGRRAHLFISIPRSSYDRNLSGFLNTGHILASCSRDCGLELRENWFCISLFNAIVCTKPPLTSLFRFPFTSNCPLCVM